MNPRYVPRVTGVFRNRFQSVRARQHVPRVTGVFRLTAHEKPHLRYVPRVTGVFRSLKTCPTATKHVPRVTGVFRRREHDRPPRLERSPRDGGLSLEEKLEQMKSRNLPPQHER